MMRKRLTALAIALAMLVACGGSDAVAPRAAVYFMIDAPLCSSIIPVELSIDGAVVGLDTFRVDVINEHLTSRSFDVAPGSHSLTARATFGYQWPVRQVTLTPGIAFTDSLPFYCS